ncbi:class I SAM-dependent methyltransferase [Synechococcus sp. CS-603]|uniref:class I SAM-dependent DNA methyltransferase n=1 Tax=Synechococcus sp. CS-603 TaxID=2847981 RepID=UPI00223BC7B8|nr:nodulation S family protein [Synechococcus sp. CS-603]MCT0202814.1 nodulation S family protein [Synechococcus sp. CS-603]
MTEVTPHIKATCSGSSCFGRDYFNLLYTQNSDPWAFESSPYEAAKYAATLAVLPQLHYCNALELGCSIGVLTQQLALRCNQLLATDISEVALAKAEVRCKNLNNVRFQRRDLSTDFTNGQFDLILVSEVANYLSQQELEVLRSNIANALIPGGSLLLVHYTGKTHYPLTADQVHQTFLEWEGVAWKSEERQCRVDYRLDLLTKINS